VPVLKVSQNPSKDHPDALYYLGNRDTHQMLTTTEVIEKPLTAAEKISLDDQRVCEAFIEAYRAKDKHLAVAYAKVLMLKAMCL
jgi:hypothetical protein